MMICRGPTGIELASSCQAQAGQRGMTLMLLTAAAIVALKNTGLGFLAGELVCMVVMRVLLSQDSRMHASLWLHWP